MVEGVIYVVNLNRLKRTGLSRRNVRAVEYVREFIRRHTKAERIVIDASINEFLLARNVNNLPARIAVSVVKLDEEGRNVKASLALQVAEQARREEGG
ncbi:MAG: 50S ribosomal protein L31e [Zestosphaera sp.]